MNKVLLSVLLLALPLVANAGRYHRHYDYAYNETGMYLGANVGAFSNSQSEDGLVGAALKIGFDLDRHIALEAHLGGSDWENYGDPHYEERIAGFTGLFFRANLPLERHKLYGLLGYSNFEFETSEYVGEDIFGEIWQNDRFERSGASYGMGLDLFLGPRSAINLQFMRYLGGEATDLNQFSVGLRYSFY